MGIATVTDDELDAGEDTGESVATVVAPGRRHCHAPGRKHRFCSQWPVKGEDYCKKHLFMKPEPEAAQPAKAVANRDPVVVGDLVPATDLDHAIG